MSKTLIEKLAQVPSAIVGDTLYIDAHKACEIIRQHNGSASSRDEETLGASTAEIAGESPAAPSTTENKVACREAFEKWASNGKNVIFRLKEDGYDNPWVAAKWAAWSACWDYNLPTIDDVRSIIRKPSGYSGEQASVSPALGSERPADASIDQNGSDSNRCSEYSVMGGVGAEGRFCRPFDSVTPGSDSSAGVVASTSPSKGEHEIGGIGYRVIEQAAKNLADQQRGYSGESPVKSGSIPTNYDSVEGTAPTDRSGRVGNAVANHARGEIPLSDEAFVLEHIWRLFDPFQSPTIGNRSPRAEESAKIMAKRVFDKLAPYLRTTEPVSLADCAMALQGNERIKLGSDLQVIAKAVLDAAEVKYVE